jgi:hypothetical protein
MRKFEFLIFKNAQKTAAPLNIRAECADRDSNPGLGVGNA